MVNITEFITQVPGPEWRLLKIQLNLKSIIDFKRKNFKSVPLKKFKSRLHHVDIHSKCKYVLS